MREGFVVRTLLLDEIFTVYGRDGRCRSRFANGSGTVSGTVRERFGKGSLIHTMFSEKNNVVLEDFVKQASLLIGRSAPIQ